jgi:predicted TIM-barrel fold metal-dependent hydrolase
MQTMPDEGHLLDLLTQFAPDQTLRDQVLVDNPQMLYDFH